MLSPSGAETSVGIGSPPPAAQRNPYIRRVCGTILRNERVGSAPVCCAEGRVPWQGRALHFIPCFVVFARSYEIRVHSHPLRHDPSVMSTIYSVMVFTYRSLRRIRWSEDLTPHAASVGAAAGSQGLRPFRRGPNGGTGAQRPLRVRFPLLPLSGAKCLHA